MRRRTEMVVMAALLILAVGVVSYVVATTRPPGPTRRSFAGPDPSVDRALLLDAPGQRRGDADAPFTLVAFDDLECFNTWNARAHIRKCMAQRPGQLRVVSHHFVAMPSHRHAPQLARAAEAAGLQGKFWPMHDRLLDRYSRFAAMSEAEVTNVVRRLAADLKLDVQRLEADMRSPATRAAFERDVALAARLGVHTTPSFFLVRPAGAPVRLSNYALMGEWLADPETWGPSPN